MLMVPKPSLEIGMDAITIGPFHVKPFSPMNMGAWALLGFSGLAFLAALDVFLEDRGGRSMRTFRVVVGVIGGVFRVFLAPHPRGLLRPPAPPPLPQPPRPGAPLPPPASSTGG